MWLAHDSQTSWATSQILNCFWHCLIGMSMSRYVDLKLSGCGILIAEQSLQRNRSTISSFGRCILFWVRVSVQLQWGFLALLSVEGSVWEDASHRFGTNCGYPNQVVVLWSSFWETVAFQWKLEWTTPSEAVAFFSVRGFSCRMIHSYVWFQQNGIVPSLVFM